MNLSETTDFNDVIDDISLVTKWSTLGPTTSRKNPIVAVYFLGIEGDERVYVGSTKDLGVRFSLHVSKLRLNQHPTKRLQDAYNTNPRLLFSYFKTRDKKEAVVLEQKILDKYFHSNKLFNASMDSLSGMKGRKHSEETISVIRQRNKDQFADPEARRRHSEITKEKMKDPDILSRMKAAQLEGIAKFKANNDLSAKQKEIAGRPEVKEKIRQSCIDRFRKVVVDGIQYDLIIDAAKAVGISDFGLISRLRNPNFPNYHYADETPTVDQDFHKKLKEVLDTDLLEARNGKESLSKTAHSFPAVYIIYFEGVDKFYISSASNLFNRLRILLGEIKKKGGVPRKPILSEAYYKTDNHNLRLSWIRCDDIRQREVMKTQLILKHLPSGKLLNDHLA